MFEGSRPRKRAAGIAPAAISARFWRTCCAREIAIGHRLLVSSDVIGLPDGETVRNLCHPRETTTLQQL